MTSTPDAMLEARIKILSGKVDDGTISKEAAELIQEFVNAHNPDYMLESPPGDRSTVTKHSLAGYVSKLGVAGEHIDLLNTDANAVNQLMQDMLDGKVGDVNSEHTIYGYQVALRAFYQYTWLTDTLDKPDPEEITITNPDGNSINPDDMLTREEIHDILNAATNTRDRAVFALLIYTGMRNGALRSLRVGDVDVSEGTWKFNADAEGLKRATQYGKRRPLLAAKGPVQEWLNHHPKSDDPEAYLITGLPDYGKAEPYTQVAQSTIGRITDKLAERAGVTDKPTNPHALRHNFVTLAKGRYSLPDETVKFLIGHSPGSNVMETTYQHIGDEEHIKRAEVAAGFREADEEEESALTPHSCTTCGNTLAPTAKACPKCGTTFTPDAADAKRSYENAVVEDAKQAETEEEKDDIDQLRNLVEENPDLLDKLGQLAGE